MKKQVAVAVEKQVAVAVAVILIETMRSIPLRHFTLFFSFLIGLSYPSVIIAQVNVGGFAEVDAYLLLREKSALEMGRVGSRLRLEVSSQAGSEAALLGLLDLEVDPVSSGKEEVSLREAYLDLYLEAVDVRLGKQIVSWGKADGINPTNNLNPSDLTRVYLDPLNPEGSKIGLWLAKVDLFFTGSTFLEGVWIPVFTPSVVTIDEQTISLGAGITVSLRNEPILPTPEIANSQGAVRLSANFAPVDAALSYFYGWDHLPDLQLETRSTGITVKPKYNRLGVAGGDFATEFAGVDLRGEGAYFFTEDASGERAEVKNPYLFYVLGLGYSFLNNDLVTNLQFAQQLVMNHKRPQDYSDTVDRKVAEEFDKVSGQRDATRNALLGRTAYTLLNQTLELSLLGGYLFERSDVYLAPRLSYDYADGVGVTFGGNFYEGGDEFSNFGMFDNFDNVFFAVKYSF